MALRSPAYPNSGLSVLDYDYLQQTPSGTPSQNTQCSQLPKRKPNNPNLFVGRILTEANQNEDFSPNTEEETSFDLKENEAVIIYTENDKMKYYKIENIKEKQTEYFPSAPPKQN